MITQQYITDFCSKYNYDIRVSGNGRWIDQKCAADVMTMIADCIYYYVDINGNSFFTTPDIWHSKYAQENVESVFKKPGVDSEAAKNEYDKFFQQPMELLAYAKVLNKKKSGNRNYYSVNDMGALEYIALREKNSLFFLKTYIEKTLSDSGIKYLFDDFFACQTRGKYEELKRGFSNFTIKYTRIRGVTECNRIFIKVLNPLAYFNNACGTERGRMSQQNITYDMLMYNRNNFRDIYSEKPKGVTRKEYAETHPVEINEAYYKYQSAKAKKFLRIFNDSYRNGLTEYNDGVHIHDLAINMHHIFPEAEYPEICYFLENLIALTPTQHYNYAHHKGHTMEIDEQYQHLLLLAKADSIKDNISNKDVETIYDTDKFIFVLHTGFDEEIDVKKDDFCGIVNVINRHYS